MGDSSSQPAAEQQRMEIRSYDDDGQQKRDGRQDERRDDADNRQGNSSAGVGVRSRCTCVRNIHKLAVYTS